MDKLKALMERAASNLSKHPVKIRWRAPARADAKAMCFKHQSGVAIIDLHPSFVWSGEDLLDAICHESAHIKQLWYEWSGVPDYASGSIRVSPQANNLSGVVKMESDADTLAAEWLEYARKHHMEHIEHDGVNSEFSLMFRCLAESDL